MQKFRSIQVLRAVAALAVVVLHAVPEPNAPLGRFGYGAFGVDLFFVISGFIMAQIARGRPPRQFVQDRLWRIYPLWWVAVLPWLLMLPRGPVFVASSLTLWPIYPGGYYSPVLLIGWTLSFELLFYAAVTLALSTRAALPLVFYAAMLLGALASSNTLVHFLGSPMGLEFLMGVVVAGLPRRAVFGWFMLLGLGLLSLTPPGTGEMLAIVWGDAMRRVILWGFPAALIVWGALSVEERFGHRRFDVGISLGNASYSIYLFHPLAAYGVRAAWPLRIAAAVALGCAMHVLVERRIMAVRKWPRATLQLRRPQQSGTSELPRTG